jgi:hypothetical protein
MSLTNAMEAAILAHLLENAAIANIGDASGLQPSATAGVVWISLHTADPGEAGAQNTSEATYTGYARKSIARTAGAWDASGSAPSQSANAAALGFDPCTAGSSTITHFGVGTDETGAGNLICRGTVTPNLPVANGITPSFPIGALAITAD